MGKAAGLGLILIYLCASLSAYAAEPFTQIQTEGPVTLWKRNTDVDLTLFTQTLFQNISSISNHPTLVGLFPSKFSVLIDGEWTGSSGYSEPNLKAPDGSLAFLIRPEAVLDPSAYNLAVHELIHLIHYNTRPHEEAWLREGIALLSEYIFTGKLNPILREGFKTPETSLIAPLDPTQSDYFGPQHGHLIQYFYYLYRLCGREALFSSLLSSPSPARGIEFLDETLRKLSSEMNLDPVCADFKTTFTAFETARFAQSPFPKSAYVLMGKDRGVVRDVARDVPPYSATAYRRSNQVTPTRSGCAQARDIPIEGACVRIRMK
jgi:hypothetical protein